MKAKSVIWTYFKVDPDNESQLICLQADCEAKISRGATKAEHYNTTNAWKHLKTAHEELEKKAREKKEADETSKAGEPSKEPSKQLSMTQFAKKGLSSRESVIDRICVYIIEELQPLSLVESPGFRKLVHGWEPNFVWPTRVHFRETENNKKI